MSNIHEAHLPDAMLQYYVTEPYPCSYLPEREARSQVAIPPENIDTTAYDVLIQRGFRRSGLFTYRPHCDTCTQCIPVRVSALDFIPDRTQRKIVNRLNRPGLMQIKECSTEFNEEHYNLYRRYQEFRHPQGGMDEDDPTQYTQFLLTSNIDTRLVEFRINEQLVMVCVMDVLADGLSAVYTFYDPENKHASFGTYAVLWQIIQCQYNNLPYLYLGYWIAESPKMSYKSRYQPIEMFDRGHWIKMHA